MKVELQKEEIDLLTKILKGQIFALEFKIALKLLSNGEKNESNAEILDCKIILLKLKMT